MNTFEIDSEQNKMNRIDFLKINVKLIFVDGSNLASLHLQLVISLLFTWLHLSAVSFSNYYYDCALLHRIAFVGYVKITILYQGIQQIDRIQEQIYKFYK